MSQQENYFDYPSQGSDPQIHWPETDALSGQFHPDSTMNDQYATMHDQYATSGHIVEGGEESEDVNYTPDMSGPADIQGAYGALVGTTVIPVVSVFKVLKSESRSTRIQGD
jgi:hypothetical protein